MPSVYVFFALMATLGICASASADEPFFGKYVCVPLHMVGVAQKGSSTSAGLFKPEQEKFFIDIQEAFHPKAICDFKTNDSLSWFFCSARFELRIDGKEQLRGDSASSFIGMPPFYGQFLISTDFNYTRFQTPFLTDGYYLSDGKCSKV